MSRILFISPATLKTKYLVDNNLEDDYIVPNIVKVEDFRMKPLLCETTYSTLTLEISGGTLSTLNKRLVDEYIQPMLAYYVMGELIYATAYKLKNEGVGDKDDTNGKEKLKQLFGMSTKFEADGRQYEELLKKFMCENGYPINWKYAPKNKIFFDSEVGRYYHTIAHKNNLKG